MAKTAIQLITAATSNALTTAEAKTHLRVDYADTTENTYIDSIIVAAQRLVENYTSRVLNDTTYAYILTSFPVNGIVLPFSPVKSITHVKYYDSDNSQQTLSTDDYMYSIYENPTTLYWIDGTPETYENRFDAVTVQFVLGYTSPATIEDDLKEAISLLVKDMYDNRTDAPREKFTAWKALAYKHKVSHSTNENY